MRARLSFVLQRLAGYRRDERGSTLVGCSSLVLLVAIAAITLLYADFGTNTHRHTIRVLPSD